MNLAGVLKSLQQAATGRKIPFARTPKVTNRTAAPAIFVLLPWLIALVFFAAGLVHVLEQTWGGLAFSLVSGVLALIGAAAFVGPRNTVTDTRLGLAGWLRSVRQTKQSPARASCSPAADAAAFLYYGELHPSTS